MPFLSSGTLVFTCLILFVLLVIVDRLCSQINDDDDDDDDNENSNSHLEVHDNMVSIDTVRR